MVKRDGAAAANEAADYVDPNMHGRWTPETGLAEAERRIRLVGDRGADTLDLGGLRLEVWPESLFALTGVKRLYLGLDAEVCDPRHSGLIVVNMRCNALPPPPRAFPGAFEQLETLDLSRNRIGAAGAAALSRLGRLTTLDVSHNGIGDAGAEALSRLGRLTTLDLSYNRIGAAGAAALSRLGRLTTLYLAHNGIGDAGAAALSRLGGLTTLDLSFNDIGALCSLEVFSQLCDFRVSYADLSATPLGWWLRPQLRRAVLWNARIDGLPAELFSKNPGEDCLPRLQNYLRERGVPPWSPGDRGSEALEGEARRDVKLMLLGNGRVGKTQIANRLCGAPFDAASDSTHGVRLSATPLAAAAPPPADGPMLRIWDFGGQDMYLGTHALFLRSRAIFAAVWAEGHEDGINASDRYLSRNLPLEYWLRYIAVNGPRGDGARPPLLVIQTRVDAPPMGLSRPPAPDPLIAQFPDLAILQYSAKPAEGAPPRAPPRRGHEDLVAHLGRICAAMLADKTVIPKVWAALAAEVERRAAAAQAADDARDAGETVPETPEDHRWIDRRAFDRLYAEQGGAEDPGLALDYLHETGAVFHRPEFFEGRVVIDQQWALNAIYAVFDRRQGAYARIRDAQRGRFTERHLAETVWRAQDYAPEERRLFLDMMRSCGVCFALDEPEIGGEITYVAPELLPERDDFRISPNRIRLGASTETARRRHAFLSPALMRTLMATVGERAGLAAEYWRDGLYLEDGRTGAGASIEAFQAEEEGAPYAGVIDVHAQGGDAEALLRTLMALVEEVERRLHLTDATWIAAPEGAAAEIGRAHEAGASALDRVAFTRPKDPPKIYISYGWGALIEGATEEDRRRERALLGIVEKAEENQTEVLFDKQATRQGDLITEFMDKIAAGDRVIVILSDKYCRSVYCMSELMKVWDYSRHIDKRFLKTIRILRLPCARISSNAYRAEIQRTWEQTRDELAQSVFDDAGRAVMSVRRYAKLRLCTNLCGEIDHLLEMIQDTISPRDVAEIDEAHFFGDWPEADAPT